MKRSCFALSILMASLSGSLLWVDAARSNNGAARAVAAREAVPRPPRVDDECETAAPAVSIEKVAATETANRKSSACQPACTYEACPYEQCWDEACPYAACEPVPPADLSYTTCAEESAAVVSEVAQDDCEKIVAADPNCLSHYDAVYDEAVYGVHQTESIVKLVVDNRTPSEEAEAVTVVEAANTLSTAAPTASNDSFTYTYEPYDYEAHTEEYAAELEDDCDYGYTYEYEYEYHDGSAESAGDSSEDPCEYGYEFDYDYYYECEGNPRPVQEQSSDPHDVQVEAAADVSSPGTRRDFRIAAAYLRDFVQNSITRCEPVRAALEAGCKIVTWSSGVDAALAVEAATAQIADLPPQEDMSTRTR